MIVAHFYGWNRVTLIAEKSHIAMYEGVVLMPAIPLLPSTSTIAACVIVEKFPEV